METLDVRPDRRSKQRPLAGNERLRSQIREYSKSFKTSWVSLGQALYTVRNDRTYYAWGFDKFEHYVEQEVGLPKQLSLKLVKTYNFLEQEEPDYLQKGFSENREASKVPGYEAVNMLRLAKQKKELVKDDYLKLKKDVFEKGKDASTIRKDLTAMIKERKFVDPEQERRERNEAAIRRLYNALNVFKKDMDALKLIPEDIVREAEALMEKLDKQL